ncbi:MAG: phospholipase D family protein [Beijerinckiaceae bacterium]
MLKKTLLRLIPKHEQIYMAFAWAHAGSVADKLIENKHKFKSVTVGLDFCATDPDFVDSLRQVPNAFVFKKGGACFHPKIYLFLTGEKAEAIVGSANFTAGGLGTNIEACLHIRCDASEAAISELLATLHSYALHRQPVTNQLAESYRRQAEIAARRPRPPTPVLPTETIEFQRIDSDLLKMSWPAFIHKARKDPSHHFETRMKFLRYLQTLFAREQSFGSLNSSEWKAVAGIIHPDAVADSGLEKGQIGWFGSMQGSGSFTNLIVNKDGRIAKAVDCIPLRGEVNESDFDRFCELFESAFADSARTGRYPTATRLLAMKRPDVFVCVNNGNKPSLAQALCFAPSTLSLSNYWERVIEPIRLAKWYNAPRPEGVDAEAWECRAALIDAIYYEAL